MLSKCRREWRHTECRSRVDWDKVKIIYYTRANDGHDAKRREDESKKCDLLRMVGTFKDQNVIFLSINYFIRLLCSSRTKCNRMKRGSISCARRIRMIFRKIQYGNTCTEFRVHSNGLQHPKSRWRTSLTRVCVNKRPWWWRLTSAQLTKWHCMRDRCKCNHCSSPFDPLNFIYVYILQLILLPTIIIVHTKIWPNQSHFVSESVWVCVRLVIHAYCIDPISHRVVSKTLSQQGNLNWTKKPCHIVTVWHVYETVVEHSWADVNYEVISSAKSSAWNVINNGAEKIMENMPINEQLRNGLTRWWPLFGMSTKVF